MVSIDARARRGRDGTVDSSANGGGDGGVARETARAARADARTRARGTRGGVENRVSRIALDRAGPALGFSRGRSRARAGTIGCFDAMEGGDGRWTRDED